VFSSFWLTVPANTSVSAPAILDVRLTAGTLERVEVFFPPGLAGLVYIQILHGLHQLVPYNPGGYLAGDNQRYVIDEAYELAAAPYTLRVVGFSDDDTFDQPVEICFLVRRPERVGALRRKLFGGG